MNQFYELQNTENIMQELKDNEGVQYLAFMIDITEQWNYLNTNIQKWNKLVTDL